jgi:pimeloyl-ACP methyl ester carboxylesterase
MRGGLLVLCALLFVMVDGRAAAGPEFRLEVHLSPDARLRPRPLLFTVGGPVYCMQLQQLASHIDASLACTDYGPNRDEGVGRRSLRREDWGDPAYDAAVATVPGLLRKQGVKISQLVVVGVSYSGYADAELVATHPELHPAALIVVDSFLDLRARYEALPADHPTRAEIVSVVGGTPEQRAAAYVARSPSGHLAGLATAIRNGMKLVVVWSLAASEVREFLGATCSRLADAQWLAELAQRLGRPVTGYVTHMPHAHALWDRGQGLLRLARVTATGRPLYAHPVTFSPDGEVPAGSYC